jgi:hypothetical protein
MQTQLSEDLAMTALSLPEPQRADLALRLIESLDGEPDPDAEQAWADEVRGRAAEVRAGTAVLVTADAAFQEAHERLARIRR